MPNELTLGAIEDAKVQLWSCAFVILESIERTAICAKIMKIIAFHIFYILAIILCKYVPSSTPMQ